MKKRIAMVLALALSLSALAACGAEKATTAGYELVEVEGDVTDVALLPVEDYVTLGAYKAMSVEVAPKEEPTEAELDEYVQVYFYNDAAMLAPESFETTGVVAEGDVILLDYEGKIDGVAFEGGTATDATLGIGSGQFIDGFEEGLVGAKVGETLDVNVTFPENYGNEELNGKPAVFTVNVKGRVGMTDSTIAAMEIQDCATVADYSSLVKLTVVYNLENEYNTNVSAAICQELLEISEIKGLPASVYNQQKKVLKEEVTTEATMYGMDADTYTTMYTGMTLEDYAAYAAEAYTLQAVIFQAVANAENLTPTDEDIDAFVSDYIGVYGEQYGMETAEDFYLYNTKEEVKSLLLQDKVIAFLTENSNITETK